jgi:hypothetical protein
MAFFVYDTIVASEVTADDIVVEFAQERNGQSGDDVTPEDDDGDDKNVITFTEASNMLRRRWHFEITKKDVSDRVSKSIEILLRIYREIAMKWAVQKKLPTFFYEVNTLSLSGFRFFYMRNSNSEIFSVFQCNEVSGN